MEPGVALFLFFEKGSHVAQASLKLYSRRLPLNSWSACPTWKAMGLQVCIISPVYSGMKTKHRALRMPGKYSTAEVHGARFAFCNFLPFLGASSPSPWSWMWEAVGSGAAIGVWEN